MSKEGKKKSIFKRWWFWVIVVVVLIGIGASSSGGDDTASTTSDNGTKQTTTNNSNKKATTAKKEVKKQDKTKVIGVGQPATIANVTFTVNKVETQTELKSDNEFVEPAKASGKFVILDVTIKNGQKEALNIDSSYFKIKTDDGTTYDPSTDGNVMMVLPTDKQFFLEQINPGIEKSGIIVFDVAKDLDLSKAYVEAQTGFWGTETVKINLGK